MNFDEQLRAHHTEQLWSAIKTSPKNKAYKDVLSLHNGLLFIIASVEQGHMGEEYLEEALTSYNDQIGSWLGGTKNQLNSHELSLVQKRTKVFEAYIHHPPDLLKIITEGKDHLCLCVGTGDHCKINRRKSETRILKKLQSRLPSIEIVTHPTTHATIQGQTFINFLTTLSYSDIMQITRA